MQTDKFCSLYVFIVISLFPGYVFGSSNDKAPAPPEALLRDGFGEPVPPDDYSSSHAPQIVVQGPERLADNIRSDLSRNHVDVDNSDRFLLSLYERLVTGTMIQHTAVYTQQLERADTIRSFTPTVEANGRYLYLTFNLSTISGQEVTSLAEMILQDSIIRRRVKTRQRLQIDILSTTSESIYSFVHLVEIERTEANTKAIEVSKAIQKITAAGFTNSRVRIRLRLKSELSNQRAVKSSDSIVLVVYTEDQTFFTKLQQSNIQTESTVVKTMVIRGESTARATRSESSSRVPKPRCGKQELIIDFEQIGWNEWLVYPKSFNAYQCIGKCRDPIASKYDPTNHAILQSLMRAGGDRSTVGRLCCVPTALQPLSMLYYEQGEIVVRHHQNMVVDLCGCR